jgi:hypothetical protein
MPLVKCQGCATFFASFVFFRCFVFAEIVFTKEKDIMTRDEAWELVTAKVKNKNLQKHMLASEAIMGALARRLDKDEEKWGLAGLIHDIDYEQTYDDPQRHGLVSAEILEEKGVDADIVHAIRAHNEHTERETPLDDALYAADALTGLIVAATLIHPEKKLSAIDKQFVLNRFKEKSFARGADRESIKICEKLGLSLEEFVEIGLEAMQEASEVLGL